MQKPLYEALCYRDRLQKVACITHQAACVNVTWFRGEIFIHNIFWYRVKHELEQLEE